MLNRASHLQMLRVWRVWLCQAQLRPRQPREQFRQYSTARAKSGNQTAAHWLGKLIVTGTTVVFTGHYILAIGTRKSSCDSRETDRWRSVLHANEGLSAHVEEVEHIRVEDALMSLDNGLRAQGSDEPGNGNDNISPTWDTITATLSTLVAAAPAMSITSLLPEWTTSLPSYFQKLKAELSMLPGSLSYELCQESFSPYLNPELQWDARVRLSPNLCTEEQLFLARRRRYLKKAFACYLDITEEEINEEDIPVIAMTCSGGGLRAMVSAAGFLWATKSAGLFDCTTYTAGVSGSCWMQALYFTSFSNASFPRLVDHLRSRLAVHFAFPPAALSLLDSAPTNRYLLRGVVEKATRGYTTFGLVDVYGVLLSARLLVPANELAINEQDFKLSSQVTYLEHGENPLPIYTCVRHEIPDSQGVDRGNEAENLKTAAAQDWFQWFEITPYELYCEDLEAGIPTWSLGRKFDRGANTTREVPELKLPLLFGIFGSAFCATLNHYYNEIRPFLAGLGWGLQTVDDLISQRRNSLKMVHAFEPACIPNYVKGMGDLLPATCPKSLHEAENIQLMDAGMSNNLACYPLLRRGRNVDVLIAFDSSADIQTYNWIGNSEGYAKQKKITGWPVSIGWPKETDSNPEELLASAEATSVGDAKQRLEEAKESDKANKEIRQIHERRDTKGLGYCTVWVGTKQEKITDEEPPPSKAVEEEWELMRPDAGITVVYFPLIPNKRVPGVDPETSGYLSTWNFEWRPEQVDETIALAKANFVEGELKVQRTIKAVYERKKRLRLERERQIREAHENELARLYQEEESHHVRNDRWFGHAFH